MRDYKDLTYPKLVDMLSTQTEKLTQLLSKQRFNDDYEKCKSVIEELTRELQRRSSQIPSQDPPLRRSEIK